MKTFNRLLLLLSAATLSGAMFSACDDDDKIPATNPSLCYSVGEIALGTTTYTSIIPSVSLPAGDREYSIRQITLNGNPTDQASATIDPQGRITLTVGSTPDCAGHYAVSVRIAVNGEEFLYNDALRVTVTGLRFKEETVSIKHLEGLTLPLQEVYLAQTAANRFSLDAPADRYAHISINPADGSLIVDPAAEAGVYPISIKVVNNTNPSGYVFRNLTTLYITSKPYALSYSPAEVSLTADEAHQSPRPTLHAATDEQGEEVEFSLVDDFGGRFRIDARTGVISLDRDNHLVNQQAATFRLQVRATNNLGTTAFPEAYVITINPRK